MVNTLKELWRRCRIFTRRRRSIKHVRTKATIGWLWFLSHTFQEQIETRLNLHYSVWASYVACLRQTVVPAHSQKNNTQSSVILSLLKYSHWISAITISIVPRSTIRFTLTFEQSSHPQFSNSSHNVKPNSSFLISTSHLFTFSILSSSTNFSTN